MNVLDSPLEALAFNYLSFGSLTLLNNLWAWLALLTAALSFWKIRSSGHPKTEPNQPEKVSTLSSENKSSQVEPVSARLDLTRIHSAQNSTKVLTEDVDGVRKGKFTVYYEEGEEEEEVQCGCSEREGLLLTMSMVTDYWNEGESEWWEKWERVLRLRNGENEKGWYTCQELTELNGNVVRLWDGGLRFRSSCCTHVW
ncbi:hypothetical protein RIF29_09221 [Crotalaria pallida]|uniref:Uncharacterized protein n=1 Tax=Crotalaria pallida TaxID=3830 RepID=A0AAN9IKI6_CROPI